MTMMLLDGKIARDARMKVLKTSFDVLSFVPTLAIIQVGDNPDSTVYIEQKKKFAKKIGTTALHFKFSEDVSYDELSQKVSTLNLDSAIHGIIIQLPLPPHLNKDAVIALVHPKKDVDGLTEENQKLLAEGHPRFVPATARGILTLLDFYGIEIKGARIAVLGRSRLVGGPTTLALRARGAQVSVCHSQTTNTREITNASDIVVVAIGRPEYVDATYIKKGSVVIDVGINSIQGQKLDEEIPQRKVVGDVKFSEVSPLARAISPVPGGVGPMTVLSLFENLLDAARGVSNG
jgi:5,10-methylene-tetrahydrofolate dehydrogenase/methenyl tetrahydrofolate cyclohydrolase